MAAEMVVPGDESEEDVELTPQQIAALDKLEDLGAGMRSSPEDPYDSDPQIRALQLVAEGRLGGPGRGQGRKRKPRAAEYVAERVRKSAGRIADAIDDALTSENENTRLKAADMALKVEREEAALQLKEDEADIDNATKEELVFALIRLSSDPATQAQLENIIDIPEEDIEEVSDSRGNSVDRGPAEASRAGSSAAVAEARHHTREARGDDRGAASRNREKAANPFTQAAKRRSSD